MDLRFSKVLNSLEIEDKTISEFQKRTSNIIAERDAKTFIEELKLRIDLCLDTGDKAEIAHHNLFLSHCYQIVFKSDEAKRYVSMAIDQFRVCGLYWNQAMAHWYLGLIYRQEGKGYLFRAEMKRALEIVDPICEEYLVIGRYEEHQNCRSILDLMHKDQEFASKMGTGPLQNIYTQSDSSAPSAHLAYLTIPWLPEYRRVRAGPLGIIWEGPSENSNTIIHTVEIDGRQCRIHSVKKFAAQDSQITLVEERAYGWARVEGHSMNASWPTTIEHGDYVLFYKHQRPPDDEIVIASCSDLNGEFAYMVKRYKDLEKVLVSETNDKNQPYEPVLLNDNYQILGIVVAVAKPVK